MSGIENEAQVKVVRTEGFYRTPAGGHKQIDLPDGTTMSMSSASVVFVNYGALLRVVSLRRGEVMFDVALDATHRPFQLTVGARVLEVEQARFSVHRSAPDRSEIRVLAGSVRIQRPRVSTASTPAQLRDPLSYSHGEAILLAGDTATFAAGWQAVSRVAASNQGTRE
jgi:ferric-dicitrate binding protein FerR (iron transport regulator)